MTPDELVKFHIDINMIWNDEFNFDKLRNCVFNRIEEMRGCVSHRIHVWYIYLHLQIN